MTFESLGLIPPILETVERLAYSEPYPIQEKAIPAILDKKDILGIAPTGSGKTASYVLPLLMNLENEISTKNRDVNILVLVPTRELAVQVNEVFQEFGNNLPQPIKSMAVYGGVSINPQMKGLFGVNVLVATPGRLLDLLSVNALSIGKINALVLDEADKMLNNGFREDMEEILSLLPKKRQNLLFSATLSKYVKNVKRIILNDPLVIQIKLPETNIDLIEQEAYFVAEERKGPLLRYLLKDESLQQVLLFVSSTFKADKVVEKLRKHDVDARAIHGKKSQNAREESLFQFKRGKLRVLVATDLLSRGIDIASLPCVINYELPRSPKDYIHRIGRTGRAGEKGRAISFIDPDAEHHFKVIQKKMGKWVTRIDSEGLF